MLEKHSFPDELIIRCLNTDYGIEVATLTFLPVGADMNAMLYKAKGRDQAEYFVKIKRGHHPDISVAIVELMHEAGIQEVIPPVKTRQGRLTCRIQNFTLVVYPFIEGENGFSRPLSENQWIQLGRALREVHEMEIPASIQSQMRRETYSSKWREVVRSLYIETHLKGNEKLRQFMQEKSRIILHLVDRAEQLAQKVESQSPKFVLCHSDIHAGNVLMPDQETLYIVDWDDPVMAPKERDLMFIGGGVANVWNELHEEKLFYKGYGKTDIDLTLLTYYRYERIVEDIAIYGQELLLTPSGEKNKAEMYQQFINMFKPQGVVDIALKEACYIIF